MESKYPSGQCKNSKLEECHTQLNHFCSLCLENWEKVCLTDELSRQPFSGRKPF